MASGNQTCRGHCADFPTVPMKSNKPMNPATDMPRSGAGEVARRCRVSEAKMSGYDREPTWLYRYTMPSNMNTSPMRVVMKALTAASRADGFLNQKPMSRKEHRPMISHPANRVRRLSLTTNRYMPKAKRETKAKKRAYMGSMEGTLCLCPCSSTVAPWGGRPFSSWSPRGAP